VETIEILRQTNKSTAALAELKGIAKTIPNQAMLINAIVLQEAKDSSEIENIITTQDELYKALTVNKTRISPQTKEVVNYRKAIFHGFDLAKRQGFLRVNDIIVFNRNWLIILPGLEVHPELF
jgi:Fic family protein